ncbi:hypothetical protein BZG36_03081 [Bifiguratus adelaidae]|uniref:Methyltransferase domain-containing protein n=1 Tax=Bifiguratus adelaidae TaxID=1938954 RepID=A0A261XZI2_9FUNG|nr:hypothetical protein BZG36_03081 [Bifiguratus adelaidae]
MGSCVSAVDTVHVHKKNDHASAKGSASTDSKPFSPRPTQAVATGQSADLSRKRFDRESTSVSQRKPKFVYNEHNRRYHNEEDTPYVLPNDDDEITRLQEFHYLTRWGLDGDFQAPVKDLLEKGAKVLDIGCGPGTWVLEMATEFPESHFTGIDISPVFPETIRPSNCEFKEVNALKGLPFPDNHFDFVYERYLELGYTTENWRFVLGEIKRVTKPGGWVQLVEMDGRPRSAGPLFKEMLETSIAALEKRHLDVTIGKNLSSLLEQCSDDSSTMFVDFRSIPVSHGGRLGDMWAHQIRVGFAGLLALFEPKWGKMTQDEFKTRIDAAVNECVEYKSYINFYFGYIQVVKA